MVFKRLRQLIALLLVTACFVVFSLPSIVSSQWGKNKVALVLTSLTKQHFDIGSISLNWTAPQVISDVTLQSKDQKVSLEQIYIEDSLLKILFNYGVASSIHIVKPQLVIYDTFKERSKAFLFPLIPEKLKISDGYVEVPTSQSKMILKNSQVVVKMGLRQKRVVVEDCEIAANSLYKNHLSKIFFKADGIESFSKMPRSMVADIQSLSTKGIDELLIHFGLSTVRPVTLESLFGEEVTIQGHINTSASKCFLHMSSDKLKLDVDSKKLKEFAVGSLLITPDLMPSLRLKNSSKLDFELGLKQPLAMKNFKTTAFEASIKLDEIVSHYGAIQAIDLFAQSNSLNSKISLTVSNLLNLSNVKGSFGSNIEILSPLKNPSFVVDVNANNLSIQDPTTQLWQHCSRAFFKVQPSGDLHASLKIQNQQQVFWGSSIFVEYRGKLLADSFKLFTRDGVLKVKGDVVNAKIPIDIYPLQQIATIYEKAHVEYCINPRIFKIMKQNALTRSLAQVETSSIHCALNATPNALRQLKCKFHSVAIGMQLSDEKKINLSLEGNLQAGILDHSYLLDAEAKLPSNAAMRLKVNHQNQQTKWHYIGHRFPLDLITPSINKSLFTITKTVAGEHLNLDINATLGQQESSYTIYAKSKFIDGHLSLKRDLEGEWIATKTSRCLVKLSPQAYEDLQKDFDRSIQLNKPLIVEGSLVRFVAPPTLDFEEMQMKGFLKINDLNLKRKDISIESPPIQLAFAKKSKEPLKIECAANIHTTSEPAKFKASLEVDQCSSPDLLLKDSSFFDHYQVQGTLGLYHCPSMIMDAFTQPVYHMSPSVLLGEQFDALMKCEIQKNKQLMHLAVNASNMTLKASSITSDGTLRLLKPVEGTLNPSSECIHALSHAFSLPISRFSQPISFDIHDKGFIVPIRESSQKTIIPLMTLKPGKVQIKNGVVLTPLLKLLKIQAASVIDIWSSPIQLTIDGNELKVKRFDFLIDDQYHICTWGHINTFEDFAKLNIGVTKDCLQKTLGIQGLPKHYVLKVPFKGKLGNMRLSKKHAVKEIGLLITQVGTSSRLKSKRSAAKEALGDFLSYQKSIPQANRPFPWEGKLSKPIDYQDNLNNPIIFKKESNKEEEIMQYNLPLELSKDLYNYFFTESATQE